MRLLVLLQVVAQFPQDTACQRDIVGYLGEAAISVLDFAAERAKLHGQAGTEVRDRYHGSDDTKDFKAGHVLADPDDGAMRPFCPVYLLDSRNSISDGLTLAVLE